MAGLKHQRYIAEGSERGRCAVACPPFEAQGELEAGATDAAGLKRL